MPYILNPSFVACPVYSSYEIRDDPIKQFSGEPFATEYASNGGLLASGMSITWNALFSNYLDYTVPKNYVSRTGTDRNKEELVALRKAEVRKYEFKLIDSPFAVKERYYDARRDRYSFRWIPGKVYRLVRVRQPLARSVYRNLKVNDLVYKEIKFHDLGRVDNLTAVLRRVRIDGSNPPYIFNETLTFNGMYANVPIVHNYGNESSFPYRAYTEVANGSSSQLAIVYAPLLAELDAIALGRCYKKLKNQKLDLAVLLAELTQTMGMISLAAISLAKSFLLVKKGRFIEAFTTLFPTSREEVANLFLVYRYGLQPLFSDIDGAARHLAESLHSLPPKKVVGKAQRRVIYDQQTVGLPNLGRTFTETSDKVDMAVDIVVKYTVLYNIFDPLMSQVSRLGFTSPINVAWELVPFSFVLDWFYPLGNYLSNLSAAEGVTIKEIYRTVSVKQVRTWNLQFHPPKEPNAYHEWDYVGEKTLSFSCSSVEVSRTVIPSAELPLLPIPKFKNPFSYGHVANALALIQQMVAKSK